MNRTFCSVCSTLLRQENESTFWCKVCQQNYYSNPKPCADIFLFDTHGNLLVARRKHNPYKGMLDIPGGFVEFHEIFEQAAMREAEEELGLNSTDFSELVYVTSYTANYPWGKETYHNIVTAFAACLGSYAKPKANDDVSEIMFVDIDQINPSEFAFQAQVDAMNQAKNLVYNKKIIGDAHVR